MTLHAPFSLADTISVPCEACRTEGRIYTTRYGGNDPDIIDCGPCPECEGFGDLLIEGEPIEEEELWLT